MDKTMNSAVTTKEDEILELWRKPKVHFDLDGEKSTLAELLKIGGYFPLAQIADRLPIPRATLLRWSRKKGEMSQCFVPIKEAGAERTMVTLVELNRLSTLINAKKERL
jgi:hypothetical protein